MGTTELVRYIYFESVEGEVSGADLKELEKYPYCGHGVILGTVKVDILRRRVDASVLLIKALGGGWKVADLPQL